MPSEDFGNAQCSVELGVEGVLKPRGQGFNMEWVVGGTSVVFTGHCQSLGSHIVFKCNVKYKLSIVPWRRGETLENLEKS